MGCICLAIFIASILQTSIVTGSAPSVNMKIGGKLPKGGSVTATCSANGKEGMQIKWFIVKPNSKIVELMDGSNSPMHTVRKMVKRVNATFIQESVTLTIKYDLMGVLSFFKCFLHQNQDLSCQGKYKCIADFSPPKRGVYMENVAMVNLDGIIRLPPRSVISKITTDSTTGKVFWIQPPGGEIPIMHYEVMYKLKSDLNFIFKSGPTVMNTSRTALIQNLRPYTEYNVYVVTVLPEQLKNSLGANGNRIQSPLYRFQTDVDGPGLEPQDMKAASIGSTYILLKWQHPPTGSWNGPLDGFHVTCERKKHGGKDLRDEKIFKWLVKGAATSKNITMLKPWSTYLVTASGFNMKRSDKSIVYGRTGNLTVSTYIAKPSTSPLNPDIMEISSTFARLKWEAPRLQNANGPIDGYILRYRRKEIGYLTVHEKSKQSIIMRDQNVNYTLSSLFPWSTYSVEVIAYNLFQGRKLESDASHEIVIQTLVSRPLTAPQNVLIDKIESKSVLLSWQPPNMLRGSNGPIDGYIVKYRRKKLGENRINSDVTYQMVVYKGQNNNFNLSDLHPWSTYTFQISAFNMFKHDKLKSPPTDSFEFATQVYEPDVSSSDFKSVFIASTSVSLNWQAPVPEKANGPIAGYTINYTRIESGNNMLYGNITVLNQDVIGGAMACRLDDLKPWSTYTVVISSYNVLRGERLYSHENEKLVIKTSVDKPSKSPVIVKTISVGSNFVEVQWKALERTDQNGPLDGYEVFYRKIAIGSRVLKQVKPIKEGVPGAVTVYKLTGLSPWCLYHIWILAYNLRNNEKLESPIGNIFSAKTRTARPSSPPTQVIVPDWSAKSITISWKRPRFEDLNGELQGYVIRVNSTVSKKSSGSRARREIEHFSILYNVSSNVTVYSVKDLDPATSYSVEVAAVTDVGHGPFSKPVFKKTDEDAPTAPRNLRILSVVNHLPVTVAWDVPIHSNGKITNYTIEIFKIGPNTTEFINVPHPTTSYNISAIDKEYKYYFRVQALTVKRGKWSMWAVLFVPNPIGNVAEQKGENVWRTYLVPIIVTVVLLLCLIIAIILYRRMRVSAYDPVKSQEKARLTNIDVEMTGAEASRSEIEEDRLFNNLDDANSIETVDRTWSDEDERLNNSESKKIPCSTPPPSSLPCHPAHPPVPIEKFHEHLIELKKTGRLQLKEEYKEFKVGQIYTWDIAIKPHNKMKNRYANIVAYDHSRVILKPIPGDVNGSDYVNACYIDGYHYPEEYIATEGPTEDTTADFWRLIWQERSNTIVCLTNLHELGKAKCHQYWPSYGSVKHGGIVISLTSTEKTADFIIRVMDISHDQSDEVRHVSQFHFLSWPDHGTPTYSTALLSLRRRIRHYYDGKTPMVVHCSAGVGRTGCFILIDDMLERSAREGTVDIYNYLHYLRTRRINMVQTEDQYMFVHDAILEEILCGKTEMLAKDLPIMLKKFKDVGKDGMTHYEREFKKLSETCPDLRWEQCPTALQPENLKKSRSLDIMARDSDRIVLKPDVESGGGNYINAVFVDGYKEKNAFVLTEAPMDSTLSVLWKMIHEKECKTIVVLYGLKESSEAYPCFWPSEEGEHAAEEYGTFLVEMISEQMDGDIFSKRLTVTSQEDGDALEVQLLQYVAWPYHDVPDSKRDILTLISRVEESQRRLGSSPILVMCSDGASRCGTFCAIYNCIERVRQEQLIDVFQCVRSIRLIRPQAVATVDQMEFIYEIVMEYLNSFDTYANFP